MYAHRTFLLFPQKMLRPGDIEEAFFEIELAQSRAACVRDVSRKDPDRGVDLVLSVQVTSWSTSNQCFRLESACRVESESWFLVGRTVWTLAHFLVSPCFEFLALTIIGLAIGC